MKESNFQLIGKPKIIRISYESNKEYVIEDDLTVEMNNNIVVTKSDDQQKCEAIIALNIGIFTSKDILTVPFQIDRYRRIFQMG